MTQFGYGRWLSRLGLLPVAVLILVACSEPFVPSAGRAESAGPTESVAPSSEPTPATLPGVEAPEACGFPDGTGLSYAGRSTTAALDVQEVVGDPMSFDPADIYITTDKFDQGALHGRLVCAIFVDQPDFVEITVHPDDGGRYSPTESSTPAPPDGISGDDAVTIAREALSVGEAWEVIVVAAGPLGQLMPYRAEDDWAGDLSADLWVWQVFLVRGDRGAHVWIDYVDGSVYGITETIVN
jgi:hypothetical protein